MFYYAWFNPIAWIFIIPPVLLAKDNAEKWVWDSVPKEGKRRWRRMQADKVREANMAHDNSNLNAPPSTIIHLDHVESHEQE
tara:strand:- start:1731 stop:1976 length:246 start_codon:yes stop_codon:yes gene_type:complete